MSVFSLNKPEPSDVIPSTTLNLTKIIGRIAAALGVATATTGAIARHDGDDNEVDWFGFDQGQRLVIVVALIAAVAVVHAADLFARSIASSRSTSTGVVPLPTIAPAKLDDAKDDTRQHNGYAIAVRPDGQVLFRHDSGDKKFEWVSGDRTHIGA